MTPFRTILVAADFSERSREAFRVACALADETKTRVFVLHVSERVPVAEQPVAFGELGMPVALPRSGFAHEEAIGERLRAVYTPNRPIDVSFRVGQGEPAEEILRAAAEVGADLIVMGTHGRGGLRRLLAGSVAEAVLRRAACPVLALHAPNDQPATARPIEVILHPTDFSEQGESAMGVARALARDCGARLVLLHVAASEILLEGMVVSATESAINRKALDEIRDRLDGPDLKFPVQAIVKEGDAIAGILRAADEERADLIVMGTHGRTGLERLLMGSVAEGVLRRASCPVLIVKRPPRKAAAPEPAGRRAVTVL
jgi:nucleotide-binding universal stress UspA family protein